MALQLPDHMPTPTCCVAVEAGMVRIHGIPICSTATTPTELLDGAQRAERRAQTIRDHLAIGSFTRWGMSRTHTQFANIEHQWWAAAFRCVAAHMIDAM